MGHLQSMSLSSAVFSWAGPLIAVLTDCSELGGRDTRLLMGAEHSEDLRVGGSTWEGQGPESEPPGRSQAVAGGNLPRSLGLRADGARTLRSAVLSSFLEPQEDVGIFPFITVSLLPLRLNSESAAAPRSPHLPWVSSCQPNAAHLSQGPPISAPQPSCRLETSILYVLPCSLVPKT